MLKRLFTAAAVTLAAILPQMQHADAAVEKKVALVVGNAAYQNAPPLGNPVPDAQAMAAAFERLGFQVISGYDLDYQGMNNTIREFRLKASKADLTAFFYAGHALQANGQNYLVPIDALFQDDAALDFEAVKVDFVMRQMRNPDGVSLVFLDACRDNPLARSLGPMTRSAVGRGLAQMDISHAGKGLAIAFATAPGEVAYDGTGINSPFTTALLKHIETEGADITEVMSRVTGEVLNTTEERQRPWLNVSLTGPVVLRPKTAPAVAMTPAPEVQAQGVEVASLDPQATVSANVGASRTYDVDAEKALFDLAHRNNDVAYYKAYLAKFPRGLFAEIAKAKIGGLSAGGAAPGAGSAQAEPQTAALGAAAASGTLALAAPAARTTPPADPAAFVLTDAMKALAGTEATERALGMDRNARREVQARLNLVKEVNVGGADGVFGPRTRAGISQWQSANGVVVTGFLTEPQLTALKAQTEKQFAAIAPLQSRGTVRKRSTGNAKASTRSYQKKAAPKKRTTKKRTTKRRTAAKRTTTKRRTTTRRSNNAGNAAAAAFVGGVVGGIIGGAISR